MVGEISGPARAVLTAERTLLNLLCHLSGVASLTAAYVAVCAPAAVLDTRKTTPGLRALEKDAVRAGGGVNHRMGLFDRVLVKDNHLALAGAGLVDAVARARREMPEVLVEVEADDLDGVRHALEAGADWILLDNMDPAALREAVALTAGRARLEASGGMTLEGARRGGGDRRGRGLGRRPHPLRPGARPGARHRARLTPATGRPRAGRGAGSGPRAGRRGGSRARRGALQWSITRMHIPSDAGHGDLAGAQERDVVRPASRAATAGNSAVRSGVTVKMIEIRSSAASALRSRTSVRSSEVLARIASAGVLRDRGRPPDRPDHRLAQRSSPTIAPSLRHSARVSGRHRPAASFWTPMPA